MSKIGLFYGTSTGNTKAAAELIAKTFNELEADLVTMFDVAAGSVKEMERFDYLILGSPTELIGELQEDWSNVLDDLDEVDLNGKQVAIFGLGDQYVYSDSFQDAIGILGEKVRELGARLVGFWSTEGFEFDESRGVEDDKFMGLPLDEDNQSELTENRIKSWVNQLKGEFGLE